MELLTTFLASLVLIGIVYLASIGRERVNKPLPPGPRGYKLYRDFLKAIFSKTLHVQFGRWANEFGEIFCLPLFGQNMVIVNSVTALRQMYIGNSRITNDRPPSFLGKYFFKKGGITFSSTGKRWKQLRQQFHGSINLHVDGGKKLEATLRTELNLTLDKLTVEGTSKNVDICAAVSHYLLSVLHMMLTGENAPADSPNLDLMKELDFYMNKSLAADQEAVLSNMPFLRHLPNSYGRRWQKMVELRTKLVDIFFNNYKTNFVNGDEGIIQRFIKQIGKDEFMTDTEVHALTMELIGAGYVTSKATITTMLLLILQNPDIQRKLREEIDTVIGNRHPCLKDQYKMPYFSSIFFESLRYSSLLPTGFPHMANEDFEFKDWHVPKDTVIFGNFFHINHDQKVWGDPWNFRPERFLEGGHDIQDTHIEARKRVVTFGVGKRSCPGENFARSRIFLFIAALFQQYEVSPPEDEKLPPCSPHDWEPALILMPNSFRCKLIPRNITLAAS